MSDEADKALANFVAGLSATASHAATAETLKTRDATTLNGVKAFLTSLATAAKSNTGDAWAVTFKNEAYKPTDGVTDLPIFILKNGIPRAITTITFHQGWISIYDQANSYLENVSRADNQLYKGLADYMDTLVKPKN